MVIVPDGARNQEWLCWRRPVANSGSGLFPVFPLDFIARRSMVQRLFMFIAVSLLGNHLIYKSISMPHHGDK
jgi:hypothetical protein